jgi:hypothetical protein
MKFQWKLFPLQRKLEWDLDMAKGRLGVLLRGWEHAASTLHALEQTRAQQAEVASTVLRRQADPLLHAQALGYLVAMEARIRRADAERRRIEEEVGAARAECLRCQQRLDTLGCVHDRALADQLTRADRDAAKVADLDWLAQQHRSAARPERGLQQ